jgi:hypothetical protein
MPIAIAKHSDWKKLTDQGLGTVVDPMVFRCGELFLKGADGIPDPEHTWELLNKNVHALGMFCDSIITNEQLPVFNYGDTFDAMLNFDQRTLTQINDMEEVLHDVNVEYEVYHEIKSAAIEELQKLYEGEKKIKNSDVRDILIELDVAGYAWNPSIEMLEEKLINPSEKTLAAYLLGGLIFTGYASVLGSEQIIQPKRSRIILALALGGPTRYEFEEQLFGELKKRAGKQYEELPWTPTFFPYLLHKADSPHTFLEELIKLRQSPEIQDYRIWFNEVINDFKDNGRIGNDKIRNIKSIAKHIDKVTGEIPSAPKVELKASIADVAGAKIPGGVDLSPALGRMWGWFLQNIPGKRYRKILTRAVIADKEYVKIENRIKKVWSGK